MECLDQTLDCSINYLKTQGRYILLQTFIDTYVYRGLTNLGNIGMSSAAALYQSFVGLILILGTNAIVEK